MAEQGLPFTIRDYTASDGYRWRYRYYQAPIARGQVVCIHGIQSHGGWYEYSCSRLARAGFDVSFLDRRGSGLNPDARGDAPSFRRLLDDLAEFLRPLRSAAGQAVDQDGRSVPGASAPLPVFLVAISWGGKLGAALQRRHPGLVDGLALLCPGFFPRVRLPLQKRAGIFWSRLVRPRQLFPIPLSEPHLFTDSPRWQQFIRDDPLSLRQATARLLFESVRLDGYLRFVKAYVRAPILLLLAGQDRIIANGPTQRFVKRFAAADKEVFEYPAAHHTLEFEPAPDEFISDLERWLERMVGQRQRVP